MSLITPRYSASNVSYNLFSNPALYPFFNSTLNGKIHALSEFLTILNGPPLHYTRLDNQLYQ